MGCEMRHELREVRDGVAKVTDQIDRLMARPHVEEMVGALDGESGATSSSNVICGLCFHACTGGAGARRDSSSRGLPFGLPFFSAIFLSTWRRKAAGQSVDSVPASAW